MHLKRHHSITTALVVGGAKNGGRHHGVCVSLGSAARASSLVSWLYLESSRNDSGGYR